MRRITMNLCLRGLVISLMMVTPSPWTALAQTEPLTEIEQHAPSADVADRPLVLGAGDLLHVSVLGAPEFDRDVRVSDSGKVALPFVGEVLVSGLTGAEAEQAVAALLSGGQFFADPQVSILVKDYATQGISVLGEVQKPGIYALLGSHTLFDAISAAGGTTTKAGRAVTINHRSPSLKPEVTFLSYGPDGSMSGNVRVLPGDTVVVSKAGIAYVVGDVKQPTAIVLENPNLTVLQAVAMAQGTNSTASLDDSKIIRKTSSGMEEIPVPLKKILSAKLSDVHLQPDDVLFIPHSAAKKAAMRTLEAIIQTATGVAIYAH